MAIASNKLALEEKLKLLHEDGVDLENKIIYLWGELEESLGTILRVKSSVIKLFWEVEKKAQIEAITLDISSYGGSIYSIYGALDFYDELKFTDNILVNTKAQGICMSAATVLLCGGTGQRTATKRCKLMLHDIQTDGIGGTATQVKEYAKALDKEQKELFRFYAEFSKPRSTRAKLTEKQLQEETKKWMDKYASNSVDHYISAHQAKELKLIDKVI